MSSRAIQFILMEGFLFIAMSVELREIKIKLNGVGGALFVNRVMILIHKLS